VTGRRVTDRSVGIPLDFEAVIISADDGRTGDRDRDNDSRGKIAIEGLHHGCPPFDASIGLNPSHRATIALLTRSAMNLTSCDSPNRLLFRREIGGMSKTDALSPEGRSMYGGRVGGFSAPSGQPG
jgi:hypothetical protein